MMLVIIFEQNFPLTLVGCWRQSSCQLLVGDYRDLSELRSLTQIEFVFYLLFGEFVLYSIQQTSTH